MDINGEFSCTPVFGANATVSVDTVYQPPLNTPVIEPKTLPNPLVMKPISPIIILTDANSGRYCMNRPTMSPSTLVRLDRFIADVVVDTCFHL